ncbi:MAG: GrpB family protein [Myxococcota bacterium]|jgi:GrpB-like predicted nucleotidyltransferase (UPF0157 family)|nr:GrpB family protein [Myxococcota bacterium]
MERPGTRIIEVVDYDAGWPARFEEEANLLGGALGSVAHEIHHVGSTAVPGLAAKPIIDILLEVTGLSALDALNEALAQIGYLPWGEHGIPQRRFFSKGDARRTHNLHAFPTGDAGVIRHLAFRDYLVAHPQIADEYAQLNKRVALSCDHDIERYCAGKDAFVKAHEARALQALTTGA